MGWRSRDGVGIEGYMKIEGDVKLKGWGTMMGKYEVKRGCERIRACCWRENTRV